MKRLVVVVVVALCGFAAAFLAFGDAARRHCVDGASPDPAYSAAFEDPVRAGDADEHVLQITRAGQPVTGAWVCVNAEPAGRPGAGVAAEARELDAGRYAVSVEFPTVGAWSGTILIGDEASGPEAAAPLTFDVTGGS